MMSLVQNNINFTKFLLFFDKINKLFIYNNNGPAKFFINKLMYIK